MKKKFSVILSILLVMVLLLATLVACKKDEEIIETPTANEIAEGYLNEMVGFIGNSIGADIANGFSVDLKGDVGFDFASTDKDKYDWNYNFDISGNVMSKGDANKDFRVLFNKGEENLLGLWNQDGNLYVEAGGEKLNFANADIMGAVRSLLALNVKGFDKLTTLPEVDTSLGSIGDIVSLMNIFVKLLAVNPDATDMDANLNITKEGEVYTANLYVDLIKSLLGDLLDIDMSFIPEGLVLQLSIIPNADKTISELNVGLDFTGDDDGQFTFNLDTAKNGLFGAVNADFKAGTPADVLAVPASSLIQADAQGQILFKGANGYVKTIDWSLKAKIDAVVLAENNFMFSKIPDELNNFFHFNLSHTCDSRCEAKCDDLISAKTAILGDRHKDTSILDIVWDKKNSGLNNIVVDLSVYDLLSTSALTQMLGADTAELIAEALKMIPSQLVLNLNPDDALKAPQNMSNVTANPVPAPASVSAAKGIDFGSILGMIKNMVTVNNFEETLDLSVAGFAELITSVAGAEVEIAGMKINLTDIINGLFDSKSTGVDTVSLSAEKANFAHYSNEGVKDYNAYQTGLVYNSNGDLKLANIDSSLSSFKEGNAYNVNVDNTTTSGTPAMAITGVELDDAGNVVFYNGKGEVIPAFTPYTLAHKYNGGKDLFVKYEFVTFDGVKFGAAEKETFTALGSVRGFAGIDMSVKATQKNVEILFSTLTGTAGILSMADSVGGMLGIDFENFIPLTTEALTVNIEFAATDITAVKFSHDIKAEYTVNGVKEGVFEDVALASTVSYVEGDTTYEFPIKATVKGQTNGNVPRDMFGKLIAGDYVAVFTNNILSNMDIFANDNKPLEVPFKVTDVTRTQSNGADLNTITGAIDKITNLGSYTYADGSTINIEPKHMENIVFDKNNLKVRIENNLLSVRALNSGDFKLTYTVNGANYVLNIKSIDKPTFNTKLGADLNFNIVESVNFTAMATYVSFGEVIDVPVIGTLSNADGALQDFPVDAMGVRVAGKYTITYTRPADAPSNLFGEDNAETKVVEIIVDEPTSKSWIGVKTGDDYVKSTEANPVTLRVNGLNYYSTIVGFAGTFEYKIKNADGSEGVKLVNISNAMVFTGTNIHVADLKAGYKNPASAEYSALTYGADFKFTGSSSAYFYMGQGQYNLSFVLDGITVQAYFVANPLVGWDVKIDDSYLSNYAYDLNTKTTAEATYNDAAICD